MVHVPSKMKCIIINLPRANARREAMYKQFCSLDPLDVQFEFLSGVDGRNLTEQDWALVDTTSRDREGRRALSQGMIGCHLSHRKALDIVATGDDELVAIFEDDVTLSKDLVTVLHALSRLYSTGYEFDFVFLHRRRVDKPFVALKRADESITLGITKFSDHGALGYVASKRGATRLLKRYPRIVHQADHTLHAYWESGSNVYSVETPVVFHGNDAGDHSFLQEGAAFRPNRNFRRLGHRALTLCREEVLKRIFFYRKLWKERKAQRQSQERLYL
ncbi:MAG: glycosyltransferase family 25 protein [Chloroflexi bacterium]|nr:glycosyltransferase family 25 protein [Chloroflexota bacterium]